MRDLVLIKDGAFVKPEKTTTNVLQQALQSYASIFLTEIGSISQIPEQGTDFELGSVNTNRFVFFANKFNNQAFSQIREPYDLQSSRILNIKRSGNTISFTVNITANSGETVTETINT